LASPSRGGRGNGGGGNDGGSPAAAPAAALGGAPLVPPSAASSAAAPAPAAAPAWNAPAPSHIDGRPAYHVNTTLDGRRVYEPQRPGAGPGVTSPEPHVTMSPDGTGHVSDLVLRTPPAAPSTVARYNQVYAPVRGGAAPKNKSDRYVDNVSGQRQRRSGGVFSPQVGDPPLSPRSTGNAAARHNVTFPVQGGGGGPPPASGGGGSSASAKL
jgi:hypothetical protein